MRNKVAIVACVVCAAMLVEASAYSDWLPAISAEHVPGTSPNFNTTFQDGCPAPSKNGLAFYMASNRPGGQGGLDIWVSRRTHVDDGWGEPENLGAPVNTAADEFCPGPLPDGHHLLFVSTKSGGCGGGDMYIARHHVRRGWATPVHLGCSVNSAAEEASPILIEYENGRRELYFSSTRPGGFTEEPPEATAGDGDIYVSRVSRDGWLSAPVLAAGVNTEFHDLRPNLRRDGLEIFFDSNRPGGSGGFDIWTAMRRSPGASWREPVNVFPVNSAQNETRPFLTWDAKTLYLGTTRTGVEGSGDIYVTTRVKMRGH